MCVFTGIKVRNQSVRYTQGSWEIMSDVPPPSVLPPFNEEDVRRRAPRMPVSGPRALPRYLEQVGPLELDQALWLWMGYRSQEWQTASVRIARHIGTHNTWFWNLQIILPIEGQGGLEIHGLAHHVGRMQNPVPPATPHPCVSAAAASSSRGATVTMSTPPRQAPARSLVIDAEEDERETKRAMRVLEAWENSPGNVFSRTPPEPASSPGGHASTSSNRPPAV